MRENLYRILALHDDSGTYKTVKSCLEGEGHQVREAENLSDLSETEGNEGADLVVIDTNSKGLQGFTMIQEIRRSSRVPVG